MGFLLTRRWLLFALTVGILAYGCWWLGEWQFGRLDQRRAQNVVVERNLSREPIPVTDVLAPSRPVGDEDEWTRVSARGSYLEQDSVVVRYQTREGAPGVDVVTPLRLEGTDTAVLVDRGWLSTQNAGTAQVDAPAAPTGTVQVTGWVRADATGDATEVDDGSTRAISSTVIEDALGIRLLGGFLDLDTENPAAATSLLTTEPPDLSEGPHFFYGLQWWFFGALALFGFGYLAYDERRHPR